LKYVAGGAVAVAAAAGGAYYLTQPSPSPPPATTAATTATSQATSQARPPIPEPTTLRIAAIFEPVSLDPANSVSGALWTVVRNTYEGLLRFKGSGFDEVEPFLATSWTISPDGKAYTFKLREGVEFQDGTPFNAEAVKFGFERVIGVNRTPAVYWKGIDKIEVLGDYEIRFTLKQPSALILKDFATLWGWQIVSPTAVKQHATSDDKWAEKWLLENSAGTGPYKIVEWVREDRVVLDKFDGYWGGWKPGQIDRVVMKLIREATTQRLLLEGGDIDIAECITLDDEKILETTPGIRVDIPDTYSNMWVVLFDANRPPFDDARVRRAISYAVNYDAYPELWLGKAKRGSSPIPSFMEHYYTPKYSYTYDLNKASQILDDVGWKLGSDGFRSKDGTKFVLTYGYSTGEEPKRRIGEQLKSDLFKAGIDVSIAPEPMSVTVGRLNKGEHPANMWTHSIYGFADYTGYMVSYYLASAFPVFNYGNYSDPRVEQLFTQSVYESNPEERIKMADELQRILTVDNPAAIFIAETPEGYGRVMRDWVQGRVYNPVYWRSNYIYAMWKGYSD
jgi:peptide/nickel transport system substrate-binding protein